MYAIIQTGGKQYRVSKGDRLLVEQLSQEVGSEVTFDQVLLIGDNGETRIGTPLLNNCRVRGKILTQERAKKIVVYKYKRRKGYDKKTGHRQNLTRVEITGIES